MTCSLLAFLKQNYLFVVLLLRRKWEMLKVVKTQSIPIDKEWFWRMFYLPSANMYWLHICPLTKKTQLFFSVFLPLNIIVFLSLHSFYGTKGFSIVFSPVKFENLWFQNVKLKKKWQCFLCEYRCEMRLVEKRAVSKHYHIGLSYFRCVYINKSMSSNHWDIYPADRIIR